jgi:cytidine deaminase
MSAASLETPRIDPLFTLARQSREAAYAPYSRFRVGAAVLTLDGQMFGGCNVENAAYGLCNCAERTALFSAVAAGYGPGQFQRMVVIGDTPGPISPCGACRQVMSELCGAGMPVLLGNLSGATQLTSVSALLPGSFSLPSSDNG